MDKKEKITLSRRGLLFSYLAVALISTLVMIAGVSMMYAALDGIAIVVSAVFLIIGMVFFTGTTAMYKEQLKKFPIEEKKQNKGVILLAFAILEVIAFALLFAGIFYVVCFPAIYWPTGIVMLLCGASLMTKSAIVYLKDTKSRKEDIKENEKEKEKEKEKTKEVDKE